jgi:hypothetical protein
MDAILAEFEQQDHSRTTEGPDGHTYYIKILRAALPAFQSALTTVCHTVREARAL